MARLTYSDLYGAVRSFLGMGSSDSETMEVKTIALQGYRDALYPLDPRTNRSYCWSWLQVHTTLSITADEDEYELPGDFGSILYDFTPGSDKMRRSLQQVDYADILNLRASFETTGYPERYAIMWDGTNNVWKAIFDPIPQEDETLKYGYIKHPTMPSADDDTLVGTQEMDDLYYAAALASAERVKLDRVGVWTQQTAILLTKLIDLDRKRAPKAIYGNQVDMAVRVLWARMMSSYPPIKES